MTYNLPYIPWTNEALVVTPMAVTTSWQAFSLGTTAPTKGITKVEQAEFAVQSSTGSFANISYYFAYDADGAHPFTPIQATKTFETNANSIDTLIANINAYRLQASETPDNDDVDGFYLVIKCNADTASITARVGGLTTQRGGRSA